MVGDFDTHQYFQRSSACCEVLFRAESDPLEGIAWYSYFGTTYQRGTSVGRSFLPTQITPIKQPAGGLCQVEQSCVEVHVCVLVFQDAKMCHTFYV